MKLLILTGLACFVALQFNAVLVHSNYLYVNLHITCTMRWFLFIYLYLYLWRCWWLDYDVNVFALQSEFGVCH